MKKKQKKSVWRRKTLIEDADGEQAAMFNIPIAPDELIEQWKQKLTSKGGHSRFHEIVRQMSDLHDKKSIDYAGGMAEGRLENFVRVGKIMRLYPGLDWASPFGVCIAFMLKQVDAGLILKSQKRDSVTGEPVGSRLTDVAVYSVLAVILDEETNEAKGV